MTSEAIAQPTDSRRFPPLGRLAGVALSVLLLSEMISLLNLRSWHAGGVTILWPTNGFVLGVLLCSPRKQWPAYLATCILVDLGINLSIANPTWMAAYLALCNIVEVIIPAILLYPTIAPKPDLSQRKQLMSLFLYGVLLGPAVASFLAVFVIGRLGQPMPWFHSFLWWFAADALGVAVMTPLYLSFNRKERLSKRFRWSALWLFVLLCSTTTFVFWQTRFPLLFLLLPILIVIGMRLGLSGSAFGLLIVSVIGGYLTTEGRGPTTLIRDSTLTMRDHALQIFIAVAMLALYAFEIVVAEGKRLQEELKASEILFRRLAETSRDMIALINLDGELTYASPAVEEVLGWAPDQLLGQNYLSSIHPNDVPVVEAVFEEALAGGMPGIFQYRRQKKDQTYTWLEGNIRMYRDAVNEKPVGFVAVVRDIASRKAAEEELSSALSLVENLARIDSLTGSANRRQFDEYLEHEWRRALRDGTYLSLLLIDVDYFKNYNDIYGHQLGDQCLRHIVEAAQSVLRRPADLLARYGGEEFAVVLPDTDRVGALTTAEHIRQVVEQCEIPHTGSPRSVVTLSIGSSTLKPVQTSSLSSLLRAADSALYQAKSFGRNRVEVASEVGPPLAMESGLA